MLRHRHVHAHHQHHQRESPGGVWAELGSHIASAASELNPFKAPTQGKANSDDTVVQTVYTTLDPTFTGAVGGYSTVGSDGTSTPTTLNKATSPTPTTGAATTHGNAQTTGTTGTTLIPGSINPTSISSLDGSSQTTLAIATSTPTTANTATATKGTGTSAGAVGGTSSSSAPSATSTSSSSSSDTSAGAKAGIAIGILAAVLIVFLLGYFLFSRRKKQLAQQRAADDEKRNAAALDRAASIYTTRTSATPPRLSLRPVTQFLPNFGERRSSKGAAIALANTTPAGGALSHTIEEDSLWERPSANRNNDPENPFGNYAERPTTAASDEAPASFSQPHNPFTAPENVVGVATTTNSPPETSPIDTAAPSNLTRKASIRKDIPKALDLTLSQPGIIPGGQVSPANTEFSVNSVSTNQAPIPSASAAAIASAGGPAHSTVHRVQLDFKPTLDDEMELRAGQLVRLLHEYDDGWALCIRLDRSQQGVVPRTCLSTRPVKPRPAGNGARNGPPINPGPGPRGPPRGPGQRPMTPQGGYPRPQSPAMRPQSPGMRPQSPSMRPQSPSMRPNSPGGMYPQPQRPRAPSTSSTSSRGVGRKPVPGQAY